MFITIFINQISSKFSHTFSFAIPENLEAIEKGQAGLHYSKRLAASESKLISSVQGEATPTKNSTYSSLSPPLASPVVKQELFSPAHHQAYRLEKLHPNICVEKVEPRTPTKAELSRGNVTFSLRMNPYMFPILQDD